MKLATLCLLLAACDASEHACEIPEQWHLQFLASDDCRVDGQCRFESLSHRRACVTEVLAVCPWGQARGMLGWYEDGQGAGSLQSAGAACTVDMYTAPNGVPFARASW